MPGGTHSRPWTWQASEPAQSTGSRTYKPRSESTGSRTYQGEKKGRDRGCTLLRGEKGKGLPLCRPSSWHGTMERPLQSRTYMSVSSSQSRPSVPCQCGRQERSMGVLRIQIHTIEKTSSPTCATSLTSCKCSRVQRRVTANAGRQCDGAVMVCCSLLPSSTCSLWPSCQLHAYGTMERPCCHQPAATRVRCQQCVPQAASLGGGGGRASWKSLR
jgi:hypothetical protein